jgi:hypothetical protein
MRALVTALSVVFPIHFANADDLPPLKPNTVEAHVDQLTSILEDISGATFEQKPTVVFASPDRIRSTMIREQRIILSAIHPEYPESFVKTVAFWQSEWMVSGVLGKCSIEDSTVYLRGRLLRNLLATVGEKGSLQDASRLVLAHELVHALQNQKVGINTSFSSTDAFSAYSAVSEGHAVSLQVEVAQRLGLQHANGVLLNLQKADIEEGWPKSSNQVEAWFQYSKGRAFVDHQSADPWTLLEHPPTTTGEIFHPTRYGNPPPQTEVIGFEGAFEPLGIQKWDKGDDEIGELALRKTLLGASADEVHRAVKGLTNGATLTAVNDHQRVSLTGYVSSDDTAAKSLFDVLKTEETRKVNELPGNTVSPVEIKLSQVEGLAIPHYRRVLRVTSSSGGGWEETTVCGLQGRLVTCLDLFQHRRKDADIVGAIQALRLEEDSITP